MARISGINLPLNKRIVISLSYLYGVGRKNAAVILEAAGVDPNIRTKDLSEADVNKIREIVEKKYVTEGELRRQITANIRRLKEIGSYRGSRHSKGLPTRGQRTKTNSRTVRGNKRLTAGSGRKATGQKT